MRFRLTPQWEGQPFPIKPDFDGSNAEAYQRALDYAEGLHKLFRKPNFSVIIERTDKVAPIREIGDDGHTIERNLLHTTL